MLILGVLGGLAPIVSMGGQVHLLDILIGAALWLLVGYGIAWLIWGRSRFATVTPRSEKSRQRDPSEIADGRSDSQVARPSEPTMRFVLDEWEADEIAELIDLLESEGIPFDLDDNGLVVEVDDESRVDDLIDHGMRPLAESESPASGPEDRLPYVAREGTELSRGEAVEALRQLKALHDEGILTDDEYETKRKTLADQL